MGSFHPTNPFPEDAAVDVPTTIQLAWDTIRPLRCPRTLSGEFTATIDFGTEPDPPEVTSQHYAFYPFDPGPLLPFTTYYWQVKPYNQRWSPVWSFTTGAPTPVEPTTWGRVKALYD